ncbi:MAG: transketolase family protein [Candidatus Tectomicrobia bacterium]|uniref:Transketolase family protein n=1 Tax=Tectimicrobiota bacterium TaxID=2528274 RepID=A0A932FWD2_UNCTE|nr:transketolase family protein [Candidatus Tectomicrobia bacterium]
MLGTREIYGETLVELGRENEHIVVLDADLSSSTRTSKFGEKFPERFFNLGVSEQDMIDTAAGLAAAGKIPFASTFAIFATGRAWEMIRQSVCYPKSNVKIVATHGGITVGPDGASHQSIEDIALMRVLPNMTVIVPADAYEARAAIRFAVQYRGPVYIRLARDKYPVLYSPDLHFEPGRARVHQTGQEATIIATGLMVSESMKAIDLLAGQGLRVGLINMSSIKPLDRQAILEAARSTGAIVTAEEHSIIGGLGSAVAEVVAEEWPVPVKRIGVRDLFGTSGDPQALLAHYGLTAQEIARAVEEAIRLKAKGENVR